MASASEYLGDYQSVRGLAFGEDLRKVIRQVTDGTVRFAHRPDTASLFLESIIWAADGSVTISSLLIGGLRVATVSKSANYTALSTDMQILVTGGAGGVTITLPAATLSGQVMLIVKVDGGVGAVTVAPGGADTIHGVAGNIVINTQWGRATLIADGVSNWVTLGAVAL